MTVGARGCGELHLHAHETLLLPLHRAGSLEVEYDTTVGFPRVVAIDWYRQMADDEVTYTASGVVPF